MKTALIAAVLLLLSISVIVFFEIRVETSGAVDFSVVETKDISIPGRVRWEQAIIAPDAKTIDQLAHTVKLAALRLKKETGADTVTVFLEPSIDRIGRAESLARVNYIPDGKGYSGEDDTPVWKVEALEPPFDWHNGIKIYETRDY